MESSCILRCTQLHGRFEDFNRAKDNHCELLEGWIVATGACSPPRATAISLAADALQSTIPEGWGVRVRSSITLKDSEPRPDLAVVRGPARRYLKAHPVTKDIALIVEVTDEAFAANLAFKRRVYARARIPVYWIINLPDSRVEVYTQPKVGIRPGFREQHDYGVNKSIPLIIDGEEVGEIPVKELLP